MNEPLTIEESEIADLKRQLAEAQAACAETKTTIDFIYHLRQFPNPDWGALDIKILERLSSCTCGQSLLDELERYRKVLERIRDLHVVTCKTPEAVAFEAVEIARNALNPK